MYVVAGATGQTGSAVADALLKQGKPTNVIVRDEQKGEPWRAKGANVAVGTFEDAAGLARILTGAEGAYLLVPPNYAPGDFLENQKCVVDSLAKAVSDSGIPHVVFLSSIGAQLDSGTGPIRAVHYGESVLGSAAKNLTVLRPGYFFENWAPVLGKAKQEGVLPTFIPPHLKIPMIATEDIGQIAAECLINPAQGRRVIELMGPEDYCPDDIARILSAMFERKVQVQFIPLSAAVSTFTGLGFSESAAKLLEEMYAAIGSGRLVYEHEQHRRIECREGPINAADALRNMLAVATKPRA